jgi:hypothetical protein
MNFVSGQIIRKFGNYTGKIWYNMGNSGNMVYFSIYDLLYQIINVQRERFHFAQNIFVVLKKIRYKKNSV